MVICPIAIVAGCKKCPAFKVCPLTTVIGDQEAKGAEEKPARKTTSSGKKKS